jgi:hypothetical protein
LSAATSQYFATVFSLHARTESVLVGAFAARWLKGSFHCISILIFKIAIELSHFLKKRGEGKPTNTK